MACNELLGERHRAIMDWYLSIILIASDLKMGMMNMLPVLFPFFFVFVFFLPI